MFGSTFEGAELVYNWFWHDWLLSIWIVFTARIDADLKLDIVAFDYRIDFHTQIYRSTHFYLHVSKHKSLYLQFTFSQNRFYWINSIKSSFCPCKITVILTKVMLCKLLKCNCNYELLIVLQLLISPDLPY